MPVLCFFSNNILCLLPVNVFLVTTSPVFACQCLFSNNILCFLPVLWLPLISSIESRLLFLAVLASSALTVFQMVFVVPQVFLFRVLCFKTCGPPVRVATGQ